MKTHTSSFKENVKLFGRELDSKITYEANGETIELESENINSVSPHYKGNILKSIMKQLDIDSNIEIPLGTELNYSLGIKTGEDATTGDSIYEYINYGNYIVYKSEKQEDTESYKLTCYDKMLYSMVDYESLGITYPITIKNYINALCTHLGLIFANNQDTFPNYNKTIPSELFLNSEGQSIGYTFRDVLDQLAEVTASTICINEEDDSLEIRYITETNDVIDGEYLKDTNVTFGKIYGPINSIVLSRAGSDNVYLQDEDSVEQNGLCEIKITDNQFMNFNNRDEFLPDILNKLDGLQYSLNDYSSTGICYYNLCDRYTINVVKVDDDTQEESTNTYSCVMFNDEVNITQGLEEHIYTELSETSETDYTKADKTDRKINQTYLIVDKQNQQIQSVITTQEEQEEQMSQIVQTVDEISSKVEDLADVTVDSESNTASLNFEKINVSEPIELKIHPINENISYLYPRNNLYPSNTLYLKTRTIRFSATYDEYNEDTGENETKTENIDYILPDDLLYYDNNTYDEFYLNHKEQVCKVIKRCGYNADGGVYVLPQETEVEYDYPTISLVNGDYVVSILGYNYGYIYAKLMTQNEFTEQFTTKAEMNSTISQTAQEIRLEVDQKTDTDELIAKINLKPGHILLEGTVTANENFKIYQDGSIEAKNGTFNGNVYLNDGGKVIGEYGILTNLQYTGNSYYWDKTGGDKNGRWLLGIPWGFSYNSETEKQQFDLWRNYHAVDMYIPENFTIQKATMSIVHSPTDINNGYATGYSRNVDLYDISDEFGQYFEFVDTYGYDFASNVSFNSEQKTNLMGNNGHTFSNQGVETYNLDITSVLVEDGVTKTGNVVLAIRSDTPYPSVPSEVTSANMDTVALETHKLCGYVFMSVDIIGYLKLEESEEE